MAGPSSDGGCTRGPPSLKHGRHHRHFAGAGLAAKGSGSTIVFSDAFSDEKRHTMEAVGAIVDDVASDRGKITRPDHAMIDRAGEVSRSPATGAATR